MKENTLFKIRNLVCSYDGIHPVLYIPALDIHSGEITVLLGRSGCGKSTLLETLGLMTNTISQNQKPYEIVAEVEGIPDLLKSKTELGFFDHISGFSSSYIDCPIGDLPKSTAKGRNKIKKHVSIWSRPRSLQELRLRHFAFIFQQTNLMPTFTARENVAIAEMAGMSEALREEEVGGRCFNNAEETLLSVGIDRSKFDRLVKELSGGERQRVAFARAINATFSVVFGDEPTGNLDENNSETLMTRFRVKLMQHGSAKRTSAIIVSHNIDLSMAFADRMILIDLKTYRMQNIRAAADLPDTYRDDDIKSMFGIIDVQQDLYSRVGPDGLRQWFQKKGNASERKLAAEEVRKLLKQHLTNFSE